MSAAICARGDYIVEVRSLSDSPTSIRSSYWVRMVGDETAGYCGGPFDTLPDAARMALKLARQHGTRAWRRDGGFMDGDHTATFLRLDSTSAHFPARPSAVGDNS